MFDEVDLTEREPPLQDYEESDNATSGRGEALDNLIRQREG
jgi:hypothetical protein